MPKGRSKEETKKGNVTFTLKAPRAKEVILMGDFNDWNASSHPMRKDESGTWKVAMKVPIGKYEYKLLVDRRWRLDSGNPQTVKNRFGTKNNVLTISGK
jgi:1,4-alpha-glucan branching enzyme